MTNEQVKTEAEVYQLVIPDSNYELTDEELETVAGGSPVEVSAGVSHNSKSGTTYSGSVKITFGKKK